MTARSEAYPPYLEVNKSLMSKTVPIGMRPGAARLAKVTRHCQHMSSTCQHLGPWRGWADAWRLRGAYVCLKPHDFTSLDSRYWKFHVSNERPDTSSLVMHRGHHSNSHVRAVSASLRFDQNVESTCAVFSRIRCRFRRTHSIITSIPNRSIPLSVNVHLRGLQPRSLLIPL